MNHSRERRLARQARHAPVKEQEIAIAPPLITLGQLLKHANIVSTGGEVRPFLESVVITVNGEPEQRRGRKLYAGDRIAFEQTVLRIVLSTEGQTDEDAEA